MTIQIKATEQYLPVVPFIMLENVSPVVDKILICDNSRETREQYTFHLCCFLFSSFNILQSKVRNYLLKV